MWRESRASDVRILCLVARRLVWVSRHPSAPSCAACWPLLRFLIQEGCSSICCLPFFPDDELLEDRECHLFISVLWGQTAFWWWHLSQNLECPRGVHWSHLTLTREYQWLNFQKFSELLAKHSPYEKIKPCKVTTEWITLKTKVMNTQHSPLPNCSTTFCYYLCSYLYHRITLLHS